MMAEQEVYYSQSLASVSQIEQLSQKKGTNLVGERFKISPDKYYPNTYMNRNELRMEMNKKSEKHENFSSSLKGPDRKEIGQFRLEILQCFGLATSSSSLLREDVQALGIAACGPFAFKTDIMPATGNPMWLARMERACLFPLFHAYQKVYVGVFDNGAAENREDFIGRVVIDISRLRPGCVYDIVLPLRMSAHVFSREKRGAIRLRLHLHWNSGRAAVTSYLPRSVQRRMQYPEHPEIQCADEKSFRNIAHLIHGAHMPGKFNIQLVKATVREANFQRIHILRYIRKQELYNLKYWTFPLISGFVFVAWMHAVYENTVAYIPAHIVTFLLLHLYKNYARFCMTDQDAFLPPTIEELFWALFNNKPIEPLTMERCDKKSSITTSILQNMSFEPDSKFEEEYEQLLSEELDDVQEIPMHRIGEHMRSSLPVKDFKRRMTTYRDCFLGADAVDFFITFGYAQSRKKAVALGRRLANETRLFQHFLGKRKFEDGPHHYQFLDYDRKCYKIKGKTPLGRSFFRFIGFQPDENEQKHVEFSYACEKDHARLAVKESLFIRNAEEAKRASKNFEGQIEWDDIYNDNDSGDEGENEGGDSLFRRFSRNKSWLSEKSTSSTGTLERMLLSTSPQSRSQKRRRNRQSWGKTGLKRASSILNVNEDQVDEQDQRNKSWLAEKSTSTGTLDRMMLSTSPQTTSQKRRRNRQSWGKTGLKRVSSMLNVNEDQVDEQDQRLTPTRSIIGKIDRMVNVMSIFEPLSSCNVDGDVVNVTNKDTEDHLFVITEKTLAKPPTQDVNEKVEGSSFVETITGTRNKTHALLGNIFNDEIYKIDHKLFPNEADDYAEDIPTRKALQSTVAKRRESKPNEMTPYQLRTEENNKILHLKNYSYGNQVIGRIGVFIQPIVETIQVALFAGRALYNIFTWQDPILSFWLGVLGPVLVLLLYLIPFRIIFGAVGIISVGPQNWIARLYRERQPGYEGPPDFDKIVKKKKKAKEGDNGEADRAKGPVFSASGAITDGSYVDPTNIRSVVVPNNVLKHHRFFEWPPEPEYARVHQSSADDFLASKPKLPEPSVTSDSDDASSVTAAKNGNWSQRGNRSAGLRPRSKFSIHVKGLIRGGSTVAPEQNAAFLISGNNKLKHSM